MPPRCLEESLCGIIHQKLQAVLEEPGSVKSKVILSKTE